MTEKSLTLLEIHLGDGDVRIAPNGLLGEAGDDADDPGAADGADGSSSRVPCGCSAGGAAKALAVVGLLAVVAVAVARLLDDGSLGDAAALDALGE